jgi:hypothetical protein
MSRMYGINIEINKNICGQFLLFLIWHQPLTANINQHTTIANHGRHQQKWPLSAPHEALRSAPTRWMDGQQPPKQADIFWGLLRVCMALKTLQCCGNESPPEQWSALRAIHTLNSPQNTSASSGGFHPSIKSVGVERKASCGVLGAISAGSGHGCGGCDAAVGLSAPS